MSRRHAAVPDATPSQVMGCLTGRRAAPLTHLIISIMNCFFWLFRYLPGKEAVEHCCETTVLRHKVWDTSSQAHISRKAEPGPVNGCKIMPYKTPVTHLNTGLASLPFTSDFSIMGNVTPKLRWQNSPMALASPGSWPPNWLQAAHAGERATCVSHCMCGLAERGSLLQASHA